MKKILLIGKNGQLGSEIMKDAASFDFEVIGFEKDELDVTIESQVEEKIDNIKPDVLINTSAYHIVRDCEKNPLVAMDINFMAVDRMSRLCKKYGVKFITYSTDYVFDGRKEVPYEENDEPHPLQMYGFSKLAGEYAALSSYPEGAFVIRTCGLYGGKTGSPEKGGNFILNILKGIQDKDFIEVSIEQVASPTYASDLSRATLKLLTSRAAPGVYHLINEGYCSWYEFAKEIFKLAGISKEIKPINKGGLDGEMKRPKFTAMKNTKAKNLDIVLPLWREGLKSYMNFLKEVK